MTKNKINNWSAMLIEMDGELDAGVVISPDGQPICSTENEETAWWIAQRLNILSNIEQGEKNLH